MKTKFLPNQFESYNFDHVHVMPHEQVDSHQQVTWELSYIIFGKGKRTIGDTVEKFSHGEIIFIPPDIEHCWEFDDKIVDGMGKIHNITIVFPVSFFERCKNNFPELFDSIESIQQIDCAISFIGKTQEQLQKLMLQMVSQNSIERLGSLFKIFEVLAKTKNHRIAGKIEKNDKTTMKMQKINLFVLKNYHRVISLDEVSAIVEMQKSSFCTFFKRVSGKTFFDYLTQFRIDSSCEMLEKTKLSIAEIAILSGFNDIPYYNRTFKKVKLCTPKEFRRGFVDYHKS